MEGTAETDKRGKNGERMKRWRYVALVGIGLLLCLFLSGDNPAVEINESFYQTDWLEGVSLDTAVQQTHEEKIMAIIFRLTKNFNGLWI